MEFSIRRVQGYTPAPEVKSQAGIISATLALFSKQPQEDALNHSLASDTVNQPTGKVGISDGPAQFWTEEPTSAAAEHPDGDDHVSVLHEIVANRRSVRRFHSAGVDRMVLDRLFRTAGRAPSAHNRQPWRFAVLEDLLWRQRLATAMGDRLRADRGADGDVNEAVERDVARSYARITEAPVVVIACACMRDMDSYPDARRRTAELMMAVQSTAMAVQNLLLAAHAERLGACIMCAPLFCGDVVSQTLNLPTGWSPQSLITLGWPASVGRYRERYDLQEIVWRPGPLR